MSWRIADAYGQAEHLGIPWQTQLRTTAPGSSDREDACLGLAVIASRSVPASVKTTAATGDPRIWISTLLMHAASSGSVRLASADPDVQPAIDLNYLSEPSDLERMRSMIRLAIELGRHSRLDGLRGELLDPTPPDLASDRALDEWILRNVLTSHHRRHLPHGLGRDGGRGRSGARARLRGAKRRGRVDHARLPARECQRDHDDARGEGRRRDAG